MLSCSIWFSAPNFWMGGGLESCCVGRVYGTDGAMHGTIRTVHTTYAAALKRHHRHRTHDSRSGSQENHMLQLNIQCPDDAHMYPKHVELRIR